MVHTELLKPVHQEPSQSRATLGPTAPSNTWANSTQSRATLGPTAAMERTALLVVALALVAVASAIDYRVCKDCPPSKQPEFDDKKNCSLHYKYDTFTTKKGWCCRSVNQFSYCGGKCVDGKVYYRVYKGKKVSPVLRYEGAPCCTAVGAPTMTYETFYCTKEHHCKEFHYWVLNPTKCACKNCRKAGTC